ncbi:CoA-transferase family III protein [Paenibacillus sp. oral taxon 786 str. D14]|uniref:CaiB/BaiF CoA transferase family protein n=1 Tax=Paenibacillus sp. oral taxon 786 TaxID=652715 RepID=UPI0001AFD476|nr:CaiB/BaiF CoA-transferase family protein [Paenibacillus sp. oral taxon 786]EES72370.1 CoA-transferase family III protein [Paenibacillus sp. oral taxon 786 str. D14]
MSHWPLQGIVVVDFSQFLSGPYASLRLADLGARVIKVERPNGGDICRYLYTSNLEMDGDSSLFHAINRNKESYAADLKNEDDRKKIRALLKKADVVIQNFRPGVIERLGFGYEQVRALNPRIVYGSISGYGKEGPLASKPGQDLLVQSFVGFPWLVNDIFPKPVPYGLPIADLITGAYLAQGILAALVRRSVSGEGALVEVSMLESMLDLMQEMMLDKLQSSSLPIDSERKGNRSARMPAGIYMTKDGFIALGSISVSCLVDVLKRMGELQEGQKEDFDEIVKLLSQKCSSHWIRNFRQYGVFCERLLDWRELLQHEKFKALDMTMDISLFNHTKMTMLACPLRLDGHRPYSVKRAPKLGEHNRSIDLCLAGEDLS